MAQSVRPMYQLGTFLRAGHPTMLLIFTQMPVADPSASFDGGAASDAPTPTPSGFSSSTAATVPPSGRGERRLAPAAATLMPPSAAGDPHAVPATGGTDAGIQQRECLGGEHDADAFSSREERLGGSGHPAPLRVAV